VTVRLVRLAGWQQIDWRPARHGTVTARFYFDRPLFDPVVGRSTYAPPVAPSVCVSVRRVIYIHFLLHLVALAHTQ